MEPRNTGPGAYHHEDNDEVFYVLEGTASFLIGDQWVDVGKGSFIRIPTGVTHDFENRTDARMGLLNFFIPGGFEEKMPPPSTGSSATGKRRKATADALDCAGKLRMDAPRFHRSS